MDKLSAEQKQYFLKFCGITELMNLADTSMEWRNLVSDQVFLDDICRRRFGLAFDELTELTEYEKLLIHTQQLVLQAKNPKFFGVHPSLAKIYAMELRSSWFPFLFNESNVVVSKNISVRDLKYPWPYDESIGGSAFYDDTKKISARIHACFPRLFELLVDSTRIQSNHDKFEYITENYPPEIKAMVAAEEIDFSLDDRQPRIIKIVTPLFQALFFFLYDDDESWRVVFHHDTMTNIFQSGFNLNLGVQINQKSSGSIKWMDSLEEIRDAMGDVVTRFCDLVAALENMIGQQMDCPSTGPFETTRADIHAVQLDLVKNLEAAIQTNASTLVDVALVSLVNVEPDQHRHHLLVQKLLKSIDNLYPCDSMVHDDHFDEGKHPSKKLSVAFCRALRRLINRAFLQEVKNFHENSRTRRLIHAWSCQGKGRKRRWCFDTNAPVDFDFERKCFMKETVSNSMCYRQGYADLWPAITLKKAIDQAPKLAKKLNSDSMKLFSALSAME